MEGERCREGRRICADRRRRHGRVRGDGGARHGAGRGQRTGRICGQVRAVSDDVWLAVGRVGRCFEHLLDVLLPHHLPHRTARESGLLSEASWRVCGWIRAQFAQEVCFGRAVSVAWLWRGAAGMAGLYERPAAPGGGLRDRRGRRRGSWARGESRRALVFADECTMLTCIFFVSSFHPAPSLLSRSKQARATPCRHRRPAAGETRQGGKEWRGRKAPAPI
eukprot:COSAG02_NODE_11047_length_1805_cov_4.269050_1_plen_221_part_00